MLNFNKRVEFRGKMHTYDNILLENIRILANYIVKDAKTLEFVIPIIKIGRDDDTIIREKIMAITPEERKRLGINKSTLWYQKKKILKGKQIKLYEKN